MGERYLYSCVISVSLGAFLAATVIGWSSPMVERLQQLEDNPLGRKITETENSWIASLSILGSCAGCLVISIIGSKFGRRTLLLAQGFNMFIFYFMMAWVENIWILYIGRFMTGVGIGIGFSILPVYLGEIAEAKNRGVINTTMVVFINAGAVFSSAAGPYFSYIWFHLSLSALSVIYIVLVFVFSPESPYYLVKLNRSEAGEILTKLRAGCNVEQTLNEMEQSSSMHSESQTSLMEILSERGTIKSLIIGIGGFTFMQLTGTSITIAYTQTILKEAGGVIPPEQGTILIGVITLVTSLFVPIIADRFPRKLLLIISHIGISLSQIPMAIYFDLKRSNEELHDITWIPLVSLIVFSIMFSVGVGPVLLTFLSELFPPKIKSLLVSLMIAYNLGGSFLLTLLFNTLQDAIGFDSLQWIFAGSGFIAVIFIRMCMIETRGKTLQEIQDELDT